MQNNWSLEKIKARQLDNEIKSGIIVIPKYQRGIVWNQNKRDLLIETIKKGLPFGSILIYKDDSGRKELIDGLQRSTTIFEFVNNPSQFFSDDDVDDDVTKNIFKLLKLSNNQSFLVQEEIKKLIIYWIKQFKTMDEVLNIQFATFFEVLRDKFPSVGEDYETITSVTKLIEPVVNKYKEICKSLVDLEIPVIELTGDKEILPDVFERINSTGSTLNKYEIFSAAWSTSNVKITDNSLFKVIDFVSNRYDSMTNGDIEIDAFDSTELKKNKEINIFDLCYGFGKLIKTKFPYLFGSIKDDIKVDSIGFNLINASLARRVNLQRNLHTALLEMGDERINVFLNKLFNTIEYIDRILRILTTFKGNKRKKSIISPNHTEYQIVSIIASVFIIKYAKLQFNDDDLIIEAKFNFDGESNKWSTNKELINKSIRIQYVMDVINESWRGSGDKKLNKIISNQDYFLVDINRSQFERELDSWFNKVLDERKEYKKIPNPKEPEKVFLNLLYLKSFTAEDHLNYKNFDIEHLITKGLIKEKLEMFDGQLRLPVSSIGNLCYLPEQENRSKGKATIYSDTNYLKSYDLKELEKRFTFTDEEDFDWISDCNNLDVFKEKFIKTLEKRYTIMKKIVLDNLYKNQD